MNEAYDYSEYGNDYLLEDYVDQCDSDYFPADGLEEAILERMKMCRILRHEDGRNWNHPDQDLLNDYIDAILEDTGEADTYEEEIMNRMADCRFVGH